MICSLIITVSISLIDGDRRKWDSCCGLAGRVAVSSGTQACKLIHCIRHFSYHIVPNEARSVPHQFIITQKTRESREQCRSLFITACRVKVCTQFQRGSHCMGRRKRYGDCLNKSLLCRVQSVSVQLTN
jgi:hypothetical protein